VAGESEFPKSDGDVLYSSEVNSFNNSFNQLKLIFNTDLSNQDDYFNVFMDTFSDTSRYESGESSNIRVNTTAGFVGLDVDNTNQIYAADFTGVSRDGTYTASETGNTSVTFDAGNDEEDFERAAGGTAGGDNSILTLDATYRDSSFIFKLDNFAGSTDGGTASTCVLIAHGITVTCSNGVSGWGATFSDGTNTFSRTSPTYIRISRAAGATKTENSSDGSSWSTVTDWTYGAIGTANAASIKIQAITGHLHTAACSFSLQAWEVNGLYSSGHFVSTDEIPSNDAKSCIMFNDSTVGGSGSTIAYQASGDGNTYTTVTENNNTLITNGTEVRVKINFTSDTLENISPLSNSYGIIYGN